MSEVALRSGVAMASDGRARAGMGTDFADVDGDGDLDLFVTNHELETHTLYRNLGKGLFSEVTAEAGLSTPTLPFVGFGTALVDHDNDGDLDIGIVNGHVVNIPTLVRPGATLAQRKLLFVNDGRGRMREIGREAGPGFAEERVGRTLVAGDIDNDGDLDLLVTNNGGNAELLRNEGGVREWLGADPARGQPEQSQRGRRTSPSDGRRRHAGARGQGRVELSGSERSARARRDWQGDAYRSTRGPLAERSERSGRRRGRESDPDRDRG